MKLLIILFLLFGSIQFADNNANRKVISDDNYNYTFYVSDKFKSNFENYKEYYWFKSGKIHSSFGGSSGQILHGLYNKTFRVNGTAEQGEFYFGLKNKVWKNWYENGKIKNIHNWQKGMLSGKYQEFTESGRLGQNSKLLVVSGKYKNNRKHGRWIYYKTKDTLYYRKGEKVTDKKKVEEDNNVKEKKGFVNKTSKFFKDIFRKKSPEEKAKAKKEKEIRKQKKEIKKKRKELAKKKKTSQKKIIKGISK